MSWWHSSKAPHSKLLSNALKRWRDRQSFPVAVLWLFEFNLSYPDFAWITSHFESNISDKNIILTHRWFNPELKSISFCRFVQVVQFPPTFRNNSGGWARLGGSKDIPSTTIKSFRNTVLTTNKHVHWVKVSSLGSHTNTVGKNGLWWTQLGNTQTRTCEGHFHVIATEESETKGYTPHVAAKGVTQTPTSWAHTGVFKKRNEYKFWTVSEIAE